MTFLRRWWRQDRDSLDKARAENRAAEEEVVHKLRQARERGVTVRLSKDALARLVSEEAP